MHTVADSEFELAVSFSKVICAGPTDRGKISADVTRPFRVDDRRQGYNIAGLQPGEPKWHVGMRQQWTTGFWVGGPMIGTSQFQIVFQVHMR
jgi:hypothetical protein